MQGRRRPRGIHASLAFPGFSYFLHPERIRNFAAAAREHPVGGSGDLCCSRPPPPVIAGEVSNASAAPLLLLSDCG